MSRIGRKPVAVPAGLKVDVSGKKIVVEGTQGKLDWIFPEGIDVAFDDKSRQVAISRKEDRRPISTGITAPGNNTRFRSDNRGRDLGASGRVMRLSQT